MYNSFSDTVISVATIRNIICVYYVVLQSEIVRLCDNFVMSCHDFGHGILYH